MKKPTSIYTRTGDQGDTSLACGRRLPKDDLRIDAYGTIDELSSILGVVTSLIVRLNSDDPAWQALMATIEWIQDKLFTLSSMIATSNLPAINMPTLAQEDVDFLEHHIDTMELDLPELKNFILPGGSDLVSFIHLARTVCRRAERVCTSLDRELPLNPLLLPFLNRLSDHLFVMARWVGNKQGEAEKIWLGRKRPDSTTQQVHLRQELADKMLHDTENNPNNEQLSLF